MQLATSTWPDIAQLSRDVVVLIPTGSLEQHGRHLPLYTDTIIATAVAQAVEANLPDEVLLTPTIWLGASAHHLTFPGSLTTSFEGYAASLTGIVESLIRHGFHRFFALNGHGGNDAFNEVALRDLKMRYPDNQFGHLAYYRLLLPDDYDSIMKGPMRGMDHASEAETSLMLHLRPELVRMDLARTDGLKPDPPIRGMIHSFDEATEDGSFGFATYGAAETGQALFGLAVQRVTAQIKILAEGYVLKSFSE